MSRFFHDRGYSLSKRGNVFYAQFWNPETKRYTTAKGTRETTEAKARQWLDQGIPSEVVSKNLTETLQADTLFYLLQRVELTAREAERVVDILTDRGLLSPTDGDDEPLVPWLLSFWDFESSPYVADKIAHGQRITRRRCQDMTYTINNHWKDFFGEKMRSEVTTEDLRAFGRYLHEKSLSAKTINNIRSAGTVALHWAHESGMIQTDPTKGLRKFSGETKKRGILTDSEVTTLFSTEWSDPRTRVGNLLAAGTGLRAGEVLGLRYEDIEQDRLHVRHSWSNQDGLKSTKTGEERIIPLATQLRGELLTLAKMNPHGAGPESPDLVCLPQGL